MIKYVYNISPDSITPVDTYKTISNEDDSLISKFTINTQFNPQKHNVQLHITQNTGEVIDSFPEHSTYKVRNTKEIEGDIVASDILINPVEDIRLYGFDDGDVRLLYHFVNDLYTERNTYVTHYIDAISPDRTELRLINLTLSSEDISRYTEEIKVKLNTQAYFSEFKLDFGDNNIIVATNIDTLDYNNQKVVVVKLYEPLPFQYNNKTPLSILEIIADSVVYQIQTSTSQERRSNIEATLRAPNFNLDIIDENVVPTGFLTYNDLFSYPVNNTNSEVHSLFAEKSIEISVDYSDYRNFIHFSSAEERLLNFKYKVQLVESYYHNLSQITNNTTQSIGITNSIREYEKLLTGLVDNFDPYERYLYYNSGSSAWPKSNSAKPYINVNSTGSVATNWFTNQLTIATGYDYSNFNSLINTIPSFLREDPKNEKYLTFIYMIGQHFDGLWLYTKAVTDKYDNDNRLNYGIPKDLIGEVLKNFGVKLYTSNNSIENLFGSLIGQTYDSGSEDINTYVTASFTGSNTPVPPYSYDDYNKQVQKRIYNNLPFLVKTKGTERGLRALINCYGIPANILTINLFGGRNNSKRPYYGNLEYATSSLDKVRLDNTGSIISGDTLSSYVSIIKRDDKYTDDLHAIEVGFSPTHNVDNYIISASSPLFNIDQYIGDPSDITQDSYNGLQQYVKTILKDLDTYDVLDYVRLIKFFDNTIFKMIKDFIPGRVVADTGIIIKPHLLQRSKAKSVGVTGQEQEYIGNIDTAFISGRHGSAINDSFITSYVEEVQAREGMILVERNNQEQPRYNGEINKSNIEIANGEQNAKNIYKILTATSYEYGDINFISQSNDICILNTRNQTTNNPYIVTSSAFTITGGLGTGNSLFINTRPETLYYISPPSPLENSIQEFQEITPPITLQQLGYPNYQEFTITANNTNTLFNCEKTISIRFATCSIGLTNYSKALTSVHPIDEFGNPVLYNICTETTPPPPGALIGSYTNKWFTNSNQQDVVWTIQYGSSSVITVIGDDTFLFEFNEETLPGIEYGDVITVTITDPLSHQCKVSKSVKFLESPFGVIESGSSGVEVAFSYYVKSSICEGSGDNTIGAACFTEAEAGATPKAKDTIDFINYQDIPGNVSPNTIPDDIFYLPQFLGLLPYEGDGPTLGTGPNLDISITTGDINSSQNLEVEGTALSPPFTPSTNSSYGEADALNAQSVLNRGLQSFFSPYYISENSPSIDRRYDVFAIYNDKYNYEDSDANAIGMNHQSPASIYVTGEDTYSAKAVYRGVNLQTELTLKDAAGIDVVTSEGVPFKIIDLYEKIKYKYNLAKDTDPPTNPLKPIPFFTATANFINTLPGFTSNFVSEYAGVTIGTVRAIKKALPVAYVIRAYETLEFDSETGSPIEPSPEYIAQITVYPVYIEGDPIKGTANQTFTPERRAVGQNIIRALYPPGEALLLGDIVNTPGSTIIKQYSTSTTKYGFDVKNIPINTEDLGPGYGIVIGGVDTLNGIPIRKRYRV